MKELVFNDRWEDSITGQSTPQPPRRTEERADSGSAAFAVVRFVTQSGLPPLEATEEHLRSTEGIYQVKVDARRHTIHILYDGNPYAIHRLCMRVCDIGMDVVACTVAHQPRQTLAVGAPEGMNR